MTYLTLVYNCNSDIFYLVKKDFFYFFSDLKGHAVQHQERLIMIGSLRDIDIKDSSHGALYPNVSVQTFYIQ